MLLGSIFEVNAIVINTVKNLRNIFYKTKSCKWHCEKIIKNYIEITGQMKIQRELRMFYEQLFNKAICSANYKIAPFLGNIFLPVINNNFSNLCENDLTEDELLISLKSMQNNKTPGNDGLTKEFYEAFWNKIKCFSEVTKTS